MIYSKENFSGGALKKVVSTSAALSWAKMEAPLTNAENDFLIPAIGKDMDSYLQKLAETKTEDLSEFEKQLLHYAMSAVGNLAFYANFDELSVRITDQGFQRQTSQDGTFQQAYKYQEDNLRRSFKNKGLNAIDSLIEFFIYAIDSDNPDVHSIGLEYAKTTQYQQIEKSIVRNVREVQSVYDIHYSAILFMALHEKMATIEELSLMPMLGPALYNALKLWLEENIAPPAERHYTVAGEEKDDEFFEELRLRCGKVMIMKAVISLLRTTGTITDRGVFFKADASSSSFAESSQLAADSRLQLMLNDAQKALDGYISSLTTFINLNMINEDNKVGNPLHALDRDNDDKAAFFA